MDEIKREKYKKFGERGVVLTGIFLFLSMMAYSNDIVFYIAGVLWCASLMLLIYASKNIILKIIFGLMILGIIIIFLLFQSENMVKNGFPSIPQHYKTTQIISQKSLQKRSFRKVYFPSTFTETSFLFDIGSQFSPALCSQYMGFIFVETQPGTPPPAPAGG